MNLKPLQHLWEHTETRKMRTRQIPSNGQWFIPPYSEVSCSREHRTGMSLQSLSSLPRDEWHDLDHTVHQSFLSYKKTCWSFWYHVIFKIGIPLLPPGAHKWRLWVHRFGRYWKYLMQNILTIDSLQFSLDTKYYVLSQEFSTCGEVSCDTSAYMAMVTYFCNQSCIEW